MGTQARQRLLRTATDLFYAEGIRAVGVERLLEVSGVGRASFYRHFASKDDLVAAALQDLDLRWRADLAAKVEAAGRQPLAVFDAVAELREVPSRGCAFLNAMVESADPDSLPHRLAQANKEAVTDFVDGLLADAGYRRHAGLAREFALLLDGATMIALREHGTGPYRRARSIAATLLDAEG